MSNAGGYKVSDQRALDVYQEALDAISDAVMTLDAAGLAARMSLPFRWATTEEEFIIESEKDYVYGAISFGATLISQGVTDFIRIASDAEFLSENYILGRHMTYAIRNAVPAFEPYENRSSLVRLNGVWCFSGMESCLRNTQWPITMPQVATGGLPGMVEDEDVADSRRWSTSPKAIYQSVMDTLSHCNLTEDFDLWCDHFAFPHSVHLAEVDDIAEEPSQIRPFFDMMTNLINTHQIDEIDRRTDRAEFISATQICGYHTTNLRSQGATKLGPVSSRYILERFGTQWKAISITNTVENTEFPYSTPEFGGALVSLRAIQERTKHK